MVRFLVLYPEPDDVVAFDHHYFDIHVPLAKKLPGLRNYTVSNGTTTMRSARPRRPIWKSWRSPVPGSRAWSSSCASHQWRKSMPLRRDD